MALKKIGDMTFLETIAFVVVILAFIWLFDNLPNIIRSLIKIF